MKKTKDFVLKLVYASLALAGIIAAGSVILIGEGDAVSKGLGTAGLIVLTDGFIIAALISRVNWLKYSIWGTALGGLLTGSIAVWSYKGYNYEEHYSTTTSEIMTNVATGFYVAALVLFVTAVFTLAHNEKIKADKILGISYNSGIILSSLSALFYGLAIAISTGGIVLRFGVASSLLSVTAALIVIIGATVKGYYQPVNQPVPYPQVNPQFAGHVPPYQAQGNNIPPAAYPYGNVPPQAAPQVTGEHPYFVPVGTATVPPVPQPPVEETPVTALVEENPTDAQ